MTSHTVVDVNASIHTIHVKTNLSTGSTIDSLTGAVTDTLAIVPVQVNPGTTIFHNPTNAIKTSPIHASHINQVSVNLVDNKGRALDLNGLSFGVCLLFEYVSKGPVLEEIDKTDTLRKELKNKAFVEGT